jgi:peroxiredoxin Q/BCP
MKTKKPVKAKSKKTPAKKASKKVTKKAVKKLAKKPLKKPVKKVTAKKTTVKKTVKKSVVSKSKSVKKSSGRMPAVGQSAPDFAVQSDTNGMTSLSRYRGKNVVLYFYPKDDTPGCTREACSFQEHKSKLIGKNAIVIGVSPDSVDSHKKFRVKYSLDFVLLADQEREVCNSYGVWVEKNNYGKKYMGVQRATFLIDASGRIAHVWPKVAVDGHTEEVLAELNRLA